MHLMCVLNMLAVDNFHMAPDNSLRSENQFTNSVSLLLTNSFVKLIKKYAKRKTHRKFISFIRSIHGIFIMMMMIHRIRFIALRISFCLLSPTKSACTSPQTSFFLKFMIWFWINCPIMSFSLFTKITALLLFYWDRWKFYMLIENNRLSQLFELNLLCLLSENIHWAINCDELNFSIRYTRCEKRNVCNEKKSRIEYFFYFILKSYAHI